MSRVVTPKNCDTSVKNAIQQLGKQLAVAAEPTFKSLTLTSLTASTLVGADASKKLESVTIGSSLNYVRPTLDTIQDIQTSASPTFVGLTLSSIAAEDSDVDKFLVDSTGVIKYRTGTQVLSDIGAQPLDDVLTDLAALTAVADNEFIVGTGAGVYAHESGATARTSLGVDAAGTASGLIGTHESTYNHGNYNTAYSHSQASSGNPHSVTPTELSLVIGTDVQAFHAKLSSLAALSYASASFIKMTGTNTFVLRTIHQTADDLETVINHDNLANGGAHDYAYITGNDGATGITAAELEELSDGSETALHSHAADSEKVKVDVGATADYIGAANNDGVLRTTTGLSFADGGNFVTLGLSFLGLEALTNPGADRLLFWDNSETALKWNSPSTGLAISGGSLGLAIASLVEDATPDGSTDYVVTSDGVTHGKVLLDNLPGGGGDGGSGYLGYIKLSDVKSTGTNGGTFTGGAWQTRTLNTEDIDTNDDCSLDANQITLDAGTYECHISCPALRVNGNQTRLYNTTGAALILTGTSERSRDNDDSSMRSFIVGRFTIAGSQALEVQHRCQTTKADIGFGSPSNVGSDEIFAVAEFWKVGEGNGGGGAEAYVDRGDPADEDWNETDLTINNAWHDLDLSGVVGSNAALVHLRVMIVDTVVGARIQFRENGNTNLRNIGTCRVQVAFNMNDVDLQIVCDSAGKIEYRATAGIDNIWITVAGWSIL